MANLHDPYRTKTGLVFARSASFVPSANTTARVTPKLPSPLRNQPCPGCGRKRKRCVRPTARKAVAGA